MVGGFLSDGEESTHFWNFEKFLFHLICPCIQAVYFIPSRNFSNGWRKMNDLNVVWTCSCVTPFWCGSTLSLIWHRQKLRPVLLGCMFVSMRTGDRFCLLMANGDSVFILKAARKLRARTTAPWNVENYDITFE